jgi:hypothetical protein
MVMSSLRCEGSGLALVLIDRLVIVATSKIYAHKEPSKAGYLVNVCGDGFYDYSFGKYCPRFSQEFLRGGKL